MDVGDGSCFLFASKTAALSIVDDGVEGINFTNDYLLDMVVWLCEDFFFFTESKLLQFKFDWFLCYRQGHAN